MTARVVDWDGAPEEPGAGGVRKRRIAGAGAELVRVEVPAGTRAGRHSHPHEQFVQVVAGEGTLETEAGRRAFRAGAVFHFPPGAWHAAEFATDTVLVETNLPEPGG
jgi:quercetin dioxygenase-like cupin family protein